MAEPLRLPLVTTSTNRAQDFTEDSRLVNAYAEKDALGELWVCKRPGYRMLYSRAATTARGQYNWGNVLYSVFGTTVYRENSSIGTVSSDGAGSAHYDFSEMVNGATLFLKSTAHAYTTDGSTTTVIADPDFPASTVPGIAYLDGTTYVMDASGRIYGSAIDSQMSWDPLNVIVAQGASGNGVALTKSLSYVIALKQWSIDFFYDAGNATGSPLSRYEGPGLSIGCAGAFTVQAADNLVFWVGQTRGGGYSVMRLEKLAAKNIATPAIAKLLRRFGVGSASSTCMAISGHLFYILTLIDEADTLTLVYDDTESVWYLWSSPGSTSWPIREISLATSAGGAVELFGQHSSNGSTVLIDQELYADLTVPFSVDIYTPNFDGGTRLKKYLHRLDVVGDQVAGSTLAIRHNGKDYVGTAWSNYRYVDLGQERPNLTDCGTFRRRAYHFHHQQDLPFRIKAAELDIWSGSL